MSPSKSVTLWGTDFNSTSRTCGDHHLRFNLRLFVALFVSIFVPGWGCIDLTLVPAYFTCWSFNNVTIMVFPQGVWLDLRLSVHRSEHKPHYRQQYLGTYGLDDGSQNLSFVELSASYLLLLWILDSKSRYIVGVSCSLVWGMVVFNLLPIQSSEGLRPHYGIGVARYAKTVRCGSPDFFSHPLTLTVCIMRFASPLLWG